MRSLIVAVSFAVLAAPAAAAGLPYEQNVIDRMLPNIQERAASSVDARKVAPTAGPPYEQYVIDRMLPNIEEPAASSGGTRAAAASAKHGSPWANDWNFIAPAM